VPWLPALDLPEDIAQHLTAQWRDLPRVALESLVAEAYRSDLLTSEQVRLLLGYATRMQVDEFLKRHEIYGYTLEDFKQDRETLRQLRTGEQTRD